MKKFLCFLVLTLSYSSYAQNKLNLKNQIFLAKVIGIADGDTMEILYHNTSVKIRLAHIDCPEKRSAQPYNKEAKTALSNLCFGQMVTIQAQKYDRYQRLVAVIINQKKQNVNQEMLKAGMAWHFKKYSKAKDYADLELVARRNKVGLWKDPNAIAPWLWRKPKR